MKKKIQTKSKPTYWDRLIAKQRKARPKHKAARKPQPKPKTMPKKTRAEAEQTDLPAPSEEAATVSEEEFLPPPDPPVVPSEPTEPPAPDAVDESEKGADPEVAATRELNIAPGSTPGEGPKPEPASEPEPQ